jgi:hypothetical protein
MYVYILTSTKVQILTPEELQEKDNGVAGVAGVEQ